MRPAIVVGVALAALVLGAAPVSAAASPAEAQALEVLDELAEAVAELLAPSPSPPVPEGPSCLRLDECGARPAAPS